MSIFGFIYYSFEVKNLDCLRNCVCGLRILGKLCSLVLMKCSSLGDVGVISVMIMVSLNRLFMPLIFIYIGIL
jgi:hypothetical protein